MFPFCEMLQILNQGTLTEGENSIQLTSVSEQLVLKKENNVFDNKSNLSNIVCTRRSTVLSLPVKKGFPD